MTRGSPGRPGPAPAATRTDIAALHAFERWPARHLWPMAAALLALTLATAGAWESPGYRPALPLLWLASGYVMFLFLLAFHDASHGCFHPVRWLNEIFGHAVGTMSLAPLSVFRFAHAGHHAYLGTPRDPELWPFTIPGVGRPARVAAAVFEILLGLLYTPLLLLHAVVVGKPSREERRAFVVGYAACGITWALNATVISLLGIWDLFLVAAIAPMGVAGALQTLNKYVQHLGLHGRSVLGLTRTVVGGRRYAELVSAPMLNNDHHGTHHRYAKIPYYHLPAATPYTIANSREPAPVFPNVVAAAVDMFPHLADPKVGPQWREGGTR